MRKQLLCFMLIAGMVGCADQPDSAPAAKAPEAGSSESAPAPEESAKTATPVEAKAVALVKFTCPKMT